MNEMTATELTHGTREALDAAKRGETTIITNYGKPVAIVGPYTGFEEKLNALQGALGAHRDACFASAYDPAVTVAGDALHETRTEILELVDLEEERPVLDALDTIETLAHGLRVFELRGQQEKAAAAENLISRYEDEIHDLYQAKLLRPAF
jgi:antitoxin (DNA-binding transcriptional repressor) of toxin-antitoxin stability system